MSLLLVDWHVPSIEHVRRAGGERTPSEWIYCIIKEWIGVMGVNKCRKGASPIASGKKKKKRKKSRSREGIQASEASERERDWRLNC